MTTDEILPELEDFGAPERPCRRCGHGDAAHTLQDFELAGQTVRRIYCEPCEDWHDFEPDPADV